MRTVRMLGLVVLASGLPAAGQAPEGPCAAIKAAALPPCDAPAAKRAPAALATVDGAALGTSDLDADLQKRIAGIDAAVAEARRAALEREIADVRLHLEAERRGVTFRDFWVSEVLLKTPPASEADMKPIYERRKKWYPGKTFEDLRPQIEGVVLTVNREKREAEVAESLKERFPAAPGADPNAPGLAPDAVLATVGGRRITAASAATRLDAAGFGARRDLYYDEQNAFETIAHARLLKAEAEKRGVSPESLEKDKVEVEQGHAVSFLGELPAAPILALDVTGAPSRGSVSAPVTVVEYADFECPHCSKAWEAAEEALKPYGERVRYVFRNYPLPFHEHALKAAEASASANAQGRFFELAGLMFKNQKSLDTPSLRKYAAEAGCEPSRFAADLDSGRYTVDVLLEMRDGGRIGVAGTPNFYVNGVWLKWESVGVAGIRAAVDSAFARAEAAPTVPAAKAVAAP